MTPFRDDDTERVTAKLLVHVLKSREGGYKLSNETLLWLAVNFEDAILPGDASALMETLEEIIRNWDHSNDYKL